MLDALTPADRHTVLRFAASFLWADLEVAPAEARFLRQLAEELGVPRGDLEALLALPPTPEDVDPGKVPPHVAAALRGIALRAIAADGIIDRFEMTLFELLDELLPVERSLPAQNQSLVTGST